MGQSAGPLGAGLGSAAGLALAPFTGGASMAIPLMTAGSSLGGGVGDLLGGGGGQGGPQAAPAMMPLQQHTLGNILPPITAQSSAPQGNIVSGGSQSPTSNPQIQALLSKLLQSGGRVG